MTDLVQVSLTDGILHIRLTRPDKKNALTVAMYAAMADALAQAEADDAVRVVLLSGAGTAFTAGNDLKDFTAPQPGAEDRPVWRFLCSIASATRPIVAAVQGPAVGIGTTMLLHCDIVVASEDAMLRLPFVDLGLVPEAASSLLLPRTMGHRRAAAMLMLGEALDARTALAQGIVSHVVPVADLQATALELARRLAAKAPAALRQTKALMKGDGAAVQARMEQEGAVFAAQLKSPEVAEAIAAFFEKRAPDFSRLAQ